MPLSETEYERMKVAIEVMDGYNLNDRMYVSRHNVLVILSKWVEDDEVVSDEEWEEFQKWKKEREVLDSPDGD